MLKTLKLLAASAAIGLAGGVSPVLAQNSMPAAGGGLGNSISAAEVSAMLAEFSIATELRANPASGAPTMVASIPGGAKFLVGFFECADAAKPAGCKQIMISTAMSSGGVAFDELNAFNGQSSVTTVVYEPTNQILIFGRNIFMPGGVGRENFKLQVSLFLGDMQNYVTARRSTAKSVSFMESPKLKSKITSITAPAETDAPRVAIGYDRATEIELAIANSFDVDFAVTADE